MNVAPLVRSLGVTGLILVVVACGSSSSKGAPTSAASVATTITSTQTTLKSAGTTAGSTTSKAPAGRVGSTQLKLTGDVNGTWAADATSPVTCGQTGPQSVVLRGVVGGHRGTLMVTSDAFAAVSLPSSHATSAEYLPDGVGGADYKAAAITAKGSGTVTFNQDGSGSVDVVIPFVVGSEGSFNGESVHVIATWTC